MKKCEAGLATILFAISAGPTAGADPVGGLTTFTAGTPARAAEVNDNFAEVADSVNDNDARVLELEAQVLELQDQLRAPGLTVVHGSEFLPIYHEPAGLDVEYHIDDERWVDKSGGPLNGWHFIGPVSLPTGAILEEVVLEACDDLEGLGRIDLRLERCPVGEETGCATVSSLSTGEFEAPGCGLFAADLSETIDNTASRYHVLIADTWNGSGTRFRAVELWWGREVAAGDASSKTAASNGDADSSLNQQSFRLPADRATRAQIPVFVLRTLEGRGD